MACPHTISKLVLQYDYLVREKIADGALIAKWRKPGYEILCSMLAIQKGNHNFGTTSLCRWAAPMAMLVVGKQPACAKQPT